MFLWRSKYDDMINWAYGKYICMLLEFSLCGHVQVYVSEKDIFIERLWRRNGIQDQFNTVTIL